MIRALKVRFAGLWWLRYVRTTPGPVPPLWAIRWVMAGTLAQREGLADRMQCSVRRRAAKRVTR